MDKVMVRKSQKQMFLESEGDEWYRRNYRTKDDLKKYYTDEDDLTNMIRTLEIQHGVSTKVLEIGCGQGVRLETLKEERGWDVIGIDPSKDAIKEMKNSKINN